MSIQRFDDAKPRSPQNRSHMNAGLEPTARRYAGALAAILIASLAGCQGINQPYAMHGLTRVPPPGTRTNYPTTNGYYGPNNATSAIQPVAGGVANNQAAASWNSQGGLPSTDLTAGTVTSSNSIPGSVSTASFSAAPQFDAYGQPLLRSNGTQQQSYPSGAGGAGNVSTAAANTWSNQPSVNASMAGFTNSPNGGYTSSLSDQSSSEPSLPSTGGSAGNAALEYPDASDLNWN